MISRLIIVLSIVFGVLFSQPVIQAQTLSASLSEAEGTEAYKKLSLKELMDLEVTSASKRAEKLSETASSLQVITQEALIRSGVTSLAESLRLAPSLTVAQVDSRQWAISARGFNNTLANKLLVLMDGRTIYTPLFSGVFWDVQDTLLEDIDRIEAISGPGATLWGANAVNGVINILTKNAKDTQGALLLAGGGSEARGFAGIRYGGELGPATFYRVYGKYFDRDSTQFRNGDDAQNDTRFGQGGFRVDWDSLEQSHFTIQGDLYNGKFSVLNQPDQEVSGGNIIGRWSRILSEGSEFKLQLYYDRTHRLIPNQFAEDLDTYDLDFQHQLRIARQHNVVWGTGYRLIRDDITNSASFAFLPPQLTLQWFNAFIQDEIELRQDKVHLTLGTKIEHNDYTGFEFQPSGRLAWKINEKQVVWGAISRAVRTPSRIDRDFFSPLNPPHIIAGGPNFVSEELAAFEIGYRNNPSEKLSLLIAAFYDNYDNIRSLEQINPPQPVPVVLANGKVGEAYGAELSLRYEISNRWNIRAGFTEIQIDIRPKPGSTDPSPGSSESHDSNHHFFFRSFLDVGKNFQLDSTFRAVSEIENQNVPAYAEMDLRFAWTPMPKVEFSIVGQNLFHENHFEFGPPTSRQQIQRSIYGKVTLRF